MPQVVPGHVLGIGPSGPIGIFFGTGDPNSSTDTNIVNANQGSLFLRTDGSTSTSLYVKTSASAWTAK